MKCKEYQHRHINCEGCKGCENEFVFGGWCNIIDCVVHSEYKPTKGMMSND